MRSSARLSLLLLPLALSATACDDEDTGQCCVALSDQVEIPAPDPMEGAGIPRNQIRQNVRFDCDFLTCVSFEGSEAFCTRECADDDPCPEGFDCEPVLESIPPPGTSSITPDSTWCVRKACNGDSDCPKNFTCQTVYQGAGTAEDPVIRQCLKDSHGCG